VRLERRGEGLRLFRRVVDDQHTVDARLRGRLGEALESHRLDRVGITHQDDRRIRVDSTEGNDQFEHLPQAHAPGQGALGSALDGRTIGHRV
jgi:hypothetical protein